MSQLTTKSEEMRNAGTDLDLEWIQRVKINHPAVLRRVQQIAARRCVKKEWQAAWLLRAVTCIDLTTLAGSDTCSNVERLCHKALHPLHYEIAEKLQLQDAGITVGAVCVYPARVRDAVHALNSIGATSIPVAAVATGFPSGQYSLETRLEEIRHAVLDGAKEIDIVINRELALMGNWLEMYDELRQMREACGEAHMKSILAVGDLGSFQNVYRASLVAMMAGSDFIKTSTGKEDVNANLPCGVVMARAIGDYHARTDYKVGFKPAGGIRTAKDSLAWQMLMKEELGNDWLHPSLFRIGASGLLADIERQLYHYATGRYAAINELSAV